MKPFLHCLLEEPWDVIVNTHFLPAEMIASLRRKGDFFTPQFTVTTDFETHRLWVNQPCEHFFTATYEGALYLQHWGIAAEDVTATGIPIHPVFSETKDRATCLKRQGLTGDRPIILQLAGGFGVGPVEQLFQAILQIEMPAEIVVVAGRNELLKPQLEACEVPPRHRVQVLGFTDQIDELMQVADVVVSKPGGLTTSETLARGAAMVIVNPVPGQESRNSDFLLENGAAIKINNVSTLTYKLTELLRDTARLARLKENAKKLGRPHAALDIARKVLQWGEKAKTK
jgi:processive 1,2-diacylglycerol beta-glucosyltransferase